MAGLTARRSTALVALLIGIAALVGVSDPPEATATAQDPEVEPGTPLTEEPLAGDVTDDELWTDAAEALELADLEAFSDIVYPEVPIASQFVAAQSEFSGDPLNLAVFPLESRRYSRGTDRLGVYVCTWNGADADVQVGQVTNVLNGPVKTYFERISGGAYNPVFVARNRINLPANQANNNHACAQAIVNSNPGHGDNGVIGVMDNGSNGGLATSGRYCPLPCTSSTSPNRFPANERWAVVGGATVDGKNNSSIPPFGNPHLTTAVHEIGHTLGWPHSNSGTNQARPGGLAEYNNPIDVMSGNLRGNLEYRVNTPYSTPAWNRYRSGWIDPKQVVIYRGGVRQIRIAPVGKGGTQMVVVPTTNKYSFLTLDARRQLGVDGNYPNRFRGVTAHYIEQLGNCASQGSTSVCWGLQSGIYTYPPAPDNLRNLTKPGESMRMSVPRGAPLVAKGTKMTVLSGNDDGYVIRLVGFADIGDSVFLSDIIWLAEEDITRGCTGTRFCPGEKVTRGQMAAFLQRALDLPSAGGQGFTDIGNSVFRADINALAAAGITRGCNPPRNDRFCPNDPITRGQMAAFLQRAFDLSSAGGQGFTDIRNSVFRGDINALAAADITRGCNPPRNDRFCPNDPVTRGQMAAFLQRADEI